MVATGTIEDLKRNAARRVTVDFREAVDRGTLPALPGVELLAALGTAVDPFGSRSSRSGDSGAGRLSGSRHVTSSPSSSRTTSPGYYAEDLIVIDAGCAAVAAADRRRRRASCCSAASCLLTAFQIIIVGQASALEETHGFSRMAEFVPAFLQRGLGNKSLLLVTFKGTLAFGYFHPVVAILISVLAIYFVTEPAHEVESGLVDRDAGPFGPPPRPRHALAASRDWRRDRGDALDGRRHAAGTAIVRVAGVRGAVARQRPRGCSCIWLPSRSCFAGFGLAVATGARRWSTAFTIAAL